MFLRHEDFATVVRSTPLISIDLIVENAHGEFLLGKRLNRPAQGYWFVPGGRVQKDEPLRAALTVAGKQSGDEVWSLPLDARLKKQTESAIADLCNTPTNNAAISASAAWLLHHFCPPTIPWAHLDISGTALWRENGRSVASGRPIPLLV